MMTDDSGPKVLPTAIAAAARCARTAQSAARGVSACAARETALIVVDMQNALSDLAGRLYRHSGLRRLSAPRVLSNRSCG